ncbi:MULTISPECIES: DUF6048 family protein [Galbibacter]|uniref:DUF6048 family protein n=1 Tax=Galbibacter pacificus TaxID=2996052 RepID=A0ABT6FV39_9FLAO|nr:DUF6048 family protein [Galbibacter pacificus]MDG3583389.1 DUF6048 family protein [Galbibacter pacificus]MDG3587134.1 DUF6048 family protein [Galbibacter pacificus]
MLKYTTSIILFLCFLSGYSQEETIAVDSTATDSTAVVQVETDSTVYKPRYGLRVGIDLSKPIRSFIDEDYKGLELVADFRVSYNFYAAAELGNEEKTTQEDNFNFTSKGSYVKLGFDWNTYDNWYGMENIINVGVRFGLSAFSQTLNEYQIYTKNQYWGEIQDGITGTNMLGEYSGLNAQWVEVVFGIKVEIFKNLFMGGSVRLNYLINQTEANQLPNLFIPGFNKVTDGSKFGVGYNYTLSYLIPIFKGKKPSKKTEVQSNEE